MKPKYEEDNELSANATPQPPPKEEKKPVDNSQKNSQMDIDNNNKNPTPTAPPGPTGSIGKLQLLKSGKMRLKIGNFVFDVTQGTTTSFLSSVGIVDIPSNQMIDLGTLENYFICTPDIESLLSLKE